VHLDHKVPFVVRRLFQVSAAPWVENPHSDEEDALFGLDTQITTYFRGANRKGNFCTPDFQKIGTSINLHGLPKILWTSKDFHELPETSMDFQGFPRTSDQLWKWRAFNFALNIRMGVEMPCTVQAEKLSTPLISL
jgi:hypothetical protein